LDVVGVGFVGVDFLPGFAVVGAAEDVEAASICINQRAFVGDGDLAGGNRLGEVAPSEAVGAGSGEVGFVFGRLYDQPELAFDDAENSSLGAGGMGAVPGVPPSVVR